MTFRNFTQVSLFVVIAIFSFSCQKNNLKEVQKELNSESSIAGPSSLPPIMELWEDAALNFYGLSDHLISPVLTDTELQLLGDLIGRSSFDSASTIFNLPISTLEAMRNSYYNSYAEYYYYQQWSLGNNESTLESVDQEGTQLFYVPLPKCEEQFGLCKDDSRINYLLGMGGCFAGGLLASGALTPIGGMLGGIGCALLEGRKHSNAIRSCQITYDNCN